MQTSERILNTKGMAFLYKRSVRSYNCEQIYTTGTLNFYLNRVKFPSLEKTNTGPELPLQKFEQFECYARLFYLMFERSLF